MLMELFSLNEIRAKHIFEKKKACWCGRTVVLDDKAKCLCRKKASKQFHVRKIKQRTKRKLIRVMMYPADPTLCVSDDPLSTTTLVACLIDQALLKGRKGTAS
jgi:hypothetical protein